MGGGERGHKGDKWYWTKTTIKNKLLKKIPSSAKKKKKNIEFMKTFLEHAQSPESKYYFKITPLPRNTHMLDKQ